MIKKILLLMGLTIFLFANTNYKNYLKIKKYDIYFKKASEIYKIPKEVLMAIAFTENESLKPNAIRHNKNKTEDIGLMQINTLWIKEFQYIGLSKQKLLDVENNIYVASLILSNLIKKYGYSLSTIAKYHSKNIEKCKSWLNRFQRHLKNIKNLNL